MIRRILLISLVICLVIDVYAQVGTNKVNPNGYNVFYYPNGVKSSEGYMKDGKPDGYWINYYPDGKKKSEGNRRNFLLDSVWIFYDEHGDTTKKITYYLGKKNGWYYTYYTSLDSGYIANTVKSKVLYVDDKRQGPGYFYYPDGKLWRVVQYKDNYIHGQVFEYAPDGRLITIITYRYGNPIESMAINRFDSLGRRNGLWREYYPNGQLKWEATYSHGKLDGYYKEYSQYGALVKYLRYRNGQAIKESAAQVKEKEQGSLRFVEEYYKNGKLKHTGAYSDTIPFGIHKFFDTTGRLVRAVWYNDVGIKIGQGMVDSAGHKTGQWTLFYDDGHVMARGRYKDDRREGKWQFYYRGGQVMEEGSYHNGKPQGLWKWYYPDGHVLIVERYAGGLLDGPYVELSPEGDTVVKANYIEGNLDGPWLFQLGDYKEVGQYQDGRRTGEWKSYYMPEGKLMCIDYYEDGYREGKHKCYYPNGKVKEIGRYISGKKNGVWNYYTEKGYLIYTITYNFGEPVKIDGKRLENVTGE